MASFFPSQSISISAPQPDSRKSVNHINHNTVGRLKWANAQLIQITWLFQLRMKKKSMTEPGKIGTFQCICAVKLLFSLARQDTNGRNCHCSLCFYFLPVTQSGSKCLFFFVGNFVSSIQMVVPGASSYCSGDFLPQFHRCRHFHKIVVSKIPKQPPQADTFPSAMGFGRDLTLPAQSFHSLQSSTVGIQQERKTFSKIMWFGCAIEQILVASSGIGLLWNLDVDAPTGEFFAKGMAQH